MTHGLPSNIYSKLIPVDTFSKEHKDTILNEVHDLLSLLFPSVAQYKSCINQEHNPYSNPEHKKFIAAYILSKHFTYD